MLSSIFEITALISRLSRAHRRLSHAHLSVPHPHIPQFTTRQRLQLVIPPAHEGVRAQKKAHDMPRRRAACVVSAGRGARTFYVHARPRSLLRATSSCVTKNREDFCRRFQCGLGG